MDSNDQTNKNQRNRNKRTDPAKRSERGYAWICLMTVIIFALILTAAAAPTRRLETQRENEEEMFWRGQQVAVAIKRYRALKGGMFPTDLNDLVRGIDRGGKKIRLLRPSALCDPMTPCADGTNWRPVNPGDPLLKELLDAIIVFQKKSTITIHPWSIQELARFAQTGSAKLPGQPAAARLDGNISPTEDQKAGSGSGSEDRKAPIIGVVSKKRGKMFLTYYGIQKYEHALFFPDIPVFTGDFNDPYLLDGASAAKDPRCPDGGVFVDGKYYGAVRHGVYCRDPVTMKSVPCSSLNK